MSFSSVLHQIFDDLVAVAMTFAAGAGPRVVAMAEGDALVLYQAQGAGALRPALPSQARKAGSVELRLPAETVLMQDFALPAAGHEYLASIVEHRLDKLMPWSRERALYGYAAREQSDGGETLVRFAATSRANVDAWLAKAGALGLSPTAIGSAVEPLDRPLVVDLLRGERDPTRKRARRLVTFGLSGAAVVATLALGGSLWLSHSADARLAAVERRTNDARRALQIATGAAAGTQEAALLAAKRPDAAMIVMLDKLARALPKDTTLRDLEIAERRVRLAGSSASAPSLIERLEGSGLVRGARFGAPVTRGAGGRDAFEILAALPDAAASDPATPPDAGAAGR